MTVAAGRALAILGVVSLSGAGCMKCGDPPPPQRDAGVAVPVRASAPPRRPSMLPEGFTHARAFVFNRDPAVEFCFAILGEGGRLCPSAKTPGVALTPAQLARALAAFDAPPPPLDVAPMCFEPHHGIVLYDDAERPVAAISVCFECERVGAWPPPKGREYDFQPLSPPSLSAFHALLCDELGLTPCNR